MNLAAIRWDWRENALAVEVARRQVEAANSAPDTKSAEYRDTGRVGGIRKENLDDGIQANAFRIALMNLGGSLVDYAKLPASRRVEVARKIEKESQQLLKRVSQKK